LLAAAVSADDVVACCHLLLPPSALLLLLFRVEPRAFEDGYVWDLHTLMSPYLDALQQYCEGG
jgi:hypothetical protein